MSEHEQEIVARLRDAYQAFNRGDLDSAMEIADPAIVFASADGQTYSGSEAVRAWAEPDAFEEQEVEPHEFRVNGNRVLVRQTTKARGAGSGIELELENLAVWTFSDDGPGNPDRSVPRPASGSGRRSRRADGVDRRRLPGRRRYRHREPARLRVG